MTFFLRKSLNRDTHYFKDTGRTLELINRNDRVEYFQKAETTIRSTLDLNNDPEVVMEVTGSPESR